MKARTKRLTLGSTLIAAGVTIFLGAFIKVPGISALLFLLACGSLITAGIVAMQRETR